MDKELEENIEKPWDSKRLTLSMGGVGDVNGFITFEISDDDVFHIFEGSAGCFEPDKWSYEDIDIEAARRLRDFLNYAVPDK